MTATFRLTRGTAPLLISMPHTGTFLPREIAARLTEAALRLPDTDWHMERLYEFADTLGASVIAGTHSRYAIDLNRPRDNATLYPGQDTTGLCPLDTFHREPLYLIGQQPNPTEIRRRVVQYWEPYHAALQAELERLRQVHGRVVLWDAHSICSVLPRFFEGRLSDLNLGTVGGASCDGRLAERLVKIASSHPGYTAVLDGRFKGGYITRHYGRPHEGVHAIQLELSQLTYMSEGYPYAFDESRAALLRPLLTEMLNAVLEP
jgi:N-formylglutamate deformylase